MKKLVTISPIEPIGVSLALLLAALPVQAVPQKPDDAERQQCTRNLKQIYQAIRSYQLEHRDLPPWLSDLVPNYLPNTNVLRCPAYERTAVHRSFGLSDPKVPGSYLYEFCDRKAPSGIAAGSTGWDRGMTMKEWKVRQLLIFGADVPLVRCWHHDPLLNLAFSGEVYESGQMWEAKQRAIRALQAASEAPLPLDKWGASERNPEDYLVGVDPDARHADQPVGHLISKTDKAEGLGRYMQRFKAERFRGSRLRMEAQVKTDAVEKMAGIWMRIDGPEGEPLAVDNMQNRPIKGTVDWTPCAVVLDVPERSQLISAGLLLAGSGKAWIADVKFEEVSKDVASTDLFLTANEEPLPLGEWSPGGSSPDRYLMGIDPGVRYAEGAVGRLHCVSDKVNGFGTFMQQFKADRYRGSRVRMTAQVKAEAVEQSTAIWMRVDGPEGKVLTFDNMQKRPIRGTVDWTPCAVVLDVPEESRMIFAGILLIGTGKAWIADVKFEKVPQDVASTDILKSSKP